MNKPTVLLVGADVCESLCVRVAGLLCGDKKWFHLPEHHDLKIFPINRDGKAIAEAGMVIPRNGGNVFGAIRVDDVVAWNAAKLEEEQEAKVIAPKPTVKKAVRSRRGSK